MTTLLPWPPLAADLVETLVRDGALTTPELISAYRETPRHVFVPRFTVGTTGPAFAAEDDEQAWLRAVYTDRSLTTQRLAHPDGWSTAAGPLLVPTSSSTEPGLMARMLESLDVRAGHRVLEIGTGTGYNAALLSHLVGSANVVSVDLDPGLVAAARERLAEIGHRPTLVVGDGELGAAEHGPYDRIIATAGVPGIPATWVEQLRPGGRVVANVRGELATGPVCVLDGDGDPIRLAGRFAGFEGHFMWLRPQADNPLRPHQSTSAGAVGTVSWTTTRLDPAALVGDAPFRFLLQLQLRGVDGLYAGETAHPATGVRQHAVSVTASDLSRADVFTESDGTRLVVQRGERRLWDTVESTWDLLGELGRPGVDRFGVTVTRGEQFVWLDSPDGPHRWPLPLV
ncbi:methyltransferase domain-containing protein [Actinokineospora sp. NBRC 105648]|uniref:methyltransferase domain-containing protein n=1 Tax=Actinokineospora sp. NBRC 105648 TaxID=3032206 RepID=UPI0024A575A2|nr:methyltransferase domain-containing protein [Actinokineospora sp. NBRC 105648]GLZ41417.1 protein-L-isoaspartate O-methyltransferase [Actinokineospora sp. NBRC 105648]